MKQSISKFHIKTYKSLRIIENKYLLIFHKLFQTRTIRPPIKIKTIVYLI